MKGCGKVFTLFLGIVLGIVFTIGGIGYAGYYLVTRDGSVGMIEDLLGDNMPIEFSDAARAKSFFNYGMDIYNAIADMENTTLGDLEEAIGAKGLVDMVASFLGVEVDILRGSKISTLTTDLLESLTLRMMFTMFKITPPDLPLFEREDVLSMPVLSAFNNLDNFTLGDFIRITEEGENQSNLLLLKLKDVSINELSNDMDRIMNEMLISEITVIITDEDVILHKQNYYAEYGNYDGYVPLVASSGLLQSLKNKQVTLGDFMTSLDDVLNDITMKELTVIITQEDIDADEAAYLADNGNLDGYEPRELSSPMMLSLKDVTLGELMSDMDSIINDLELGEVIEITEESNAALYALRNTKIGELGGSEADETIKNLKISDLIEIGEESTQVMKYFRDNEVTLNGIDDAIKRMRMSNIIEITEESSVLMKSLQDAALETYVDDNGTPEDPSDDFEVLGIEETIAILPLSGIVEIITDEDAQNDPSLTPSSRIMQSLANSTLDNLDATIKVLTLSEMITITTDEDVLLHEQEYLLEHGNLDGYTPLVPSSRFMQALKDCPLETYEDEFSVVHLGIDDKLQITPLSDLVVVGTSHVWNYLGDKTFNELGVAVDNMTLGDAVLIFEDDPVDPGDPPKSHAILIALKDSKISEIGVDLPNAIDDCLLSDIITIDASSPAILKALADKGVKVGEMNTAIADLTVEDVYPDATGVLTLVDPATKIQDLPDALTDAMTTSTLAELQDAGLINNVSPSIEGWTIQDLVDATIAPTP